MDAVTKSVCADVHCHVHCCRSMFGVDVGNDIAVYICEISITQ